MTGRGSSPELSVVATVRERIRLGVLERAFPEDLAAHPWLPAAAMQARFDQWAARVRDRWPLPAEVEQAVQAGVARVVLPFRLGPCTEPAGCELCALAE